MSLPANDSGAPMSPVVRGTMAFGDTLRAGPLPEPDCDDVGARLRGPMPAYNR